MVVLFDFDGVIMDTERQYTVFWDSIGEKYLGRGGLGADVKGQTLKLIFKNFFPDNIQELQEITSLLDKFEEEMPYIPVRGAFDLIRDLKAHSVPMAIVTSSNAVKMKNVYRHYPELPGLVGHIYTSEYFTHSKPDPECFVKAMKDLGGSESDTVVFEDSINGLKAARASGAFVGGLTTGNPENVVAQYSDIQIPDFSAIKYSTIENWLKEREIIFGKDARKS